jgi:hypothetical protein
MLLVVELAGELLVHEPESCLTLMSLMMFFQYQIYFPNLPQFGDTKPCYTLIFTNFKKEKQ